jgi:hypothetical protein
MNQPERHHCERAAFRPIPSAIYTALETNISLQSELQRLLMKIKCKKALNRRDAARVMMHCQDEGDHSLIMALSTTGDDAAALISENDDSIRSGASRKRDGSSAFVAVDIDDTRVGTAVTESVAGKRSKLASTSNRKETRRFFMDKDGSTPVSVAWDMGRENDIGQPQTVIFERYDQSHTSAEESVPKTSWKQVKKSAWKDNSLEEVSIKIVNTPSRPVENRLVPFFHFADPKMAAAKLSKQECNFITSIIKKAEGDTQKSIDWYKLAMKLHEQINHQSPWRCFCFFRSSIQHITTWSPEEDELLLKYLAIHGPQYLLQGDCAVQTCRNLFPDRSTKQVILRAQSSLINPNYVQNAWDTYEKRKLALLVRAYSNEPNPINSVSRPVHFPHRAPKSVAEKWINTLNPSMHHQFT